MLVFILLMGEFIIRPLGGGKVFFIGMRWSISSCSRATGRSERRSPSASSWS
jgi:hypothetical protein